MTKRPHLLAAFCVLLLTIILSNQASALYDPGVGRFCSRDPIGYAGSPFDLYETLDGHAVSGTDAYGLKCCLRTYWFPRWRSGSHSVLKCTNGYYSVYPNSEATADGIPHADYGTEELDNDGTRMTEVCLECLDETAIAAKWNNELSRIRWTDYRNCAWFTWHLLTAGMIGKDESECSEQECPLCSHYKVCTNSCVPGTGIFYSPWGTERYAKCLAEKQCDPWEINCVTPWDMHY